MKETLFNIARAAFVCVMLFSTYSRCQKAKKADKPEPIPMTRELREALEERLRK